MSASMPPHSSRVPRRSSSLSPRAARSCRLRSTSTDGVATPTAATSPTAAGSTAGGQKPHAWTYTRATLPRARASAEGVESDPRLGWLSSRRGIESDSADDRTTTSQGIECPPLKHGAGESRTPTPAKGEQAPSPTTNSSEVSHGLSKRRRKKKSAYSQKSLPMDILHHVGIGTGTTGAQTSPRMPSRANRTFTNADLETDKNRAPVAPSMASKYSVGERERVVGVPTSAPASPITSSRAKLFKQSDVADSPRRASQGAGGRRHVDDVAAFSEYRQRRPRSRSPRFLSTDQYHFPRLPQDIEEHARLIPLPSSDQDSQHADVSSNLTPRPSLYSSGTPEEHACTCDDIPSPLSQRPLTPTLARSRKSPRSFSFNLTGGASSPPSALSDRTSLLSSPRRPLGPQRPLTPPAGSSSRRASRNVRRSTATCDACRGLPRTSSNMMSSSSAGHHKSTPSGAPRISELKPRPPTASSEPTTPVASSHISQVGSPGALARAPASGAHQPAMSGSSSQNNEEKHQSSRPQSILSNTRGSSRSSSHMSPKDAMEKLHALESLRKEGLLSDEEYDQRRQQLIDIVTGTTNKLPRARDRRKPASRSSRHSPSPTPVLKLPFPPLRLPTGSPVPSIPTEPVLLDENPPSSHEAAKRKPPRDVNSLFLGKMLHHRAQSLQLPFSKSSSRSPSASATRKSDAPLISSAMRERGRGYSFDSGVAYLIENNGDTMETPPRSALKDLGGKEGEEAAPPAANANASSSVSPAPAPAESPRRTLPQPPSSLVRRTTPPRASKKNSHVRRSHTHTSGQRRKKPKQAAFEPGYPPSNDSVIGVPAVEAGPPPDWNDLPLEHATKHVFDHVTGSWSHQRICVKMAKKPFARGTLRLAYYMKEYPTLSKRSAFVPAAERGRKKKRSTGASSTNKSDSSTRSAESGRSGASSSSAASTSSPYSPRLFSFARKLTLKSIRKSTVASRESVAEAKAAAQRKQSLRSGSRHGNLHRGLALTENELDPGRSLVAKISIDPYEEKDTYFRDVAMQAFAQQSANMYNKYDPPKRVAFIQSWVVQLTDRPRPVYCGVEEFVDGPYRKHNNNFGFVDDNERSTPQAFSHFTYEVSQRKLLICDIQGVNDLYTDPEMHSVDGTGFGKGNMGRKGIEKFIASHRCNAICEYFKLPLINDTLPARTTQSGSGVNQALGSGGGYNHDEGTLPASRHMSFDKVAVLTSVRETYQNPMQAFDPLPPRKKKAKNATVLPRSPRRGLWCCCVF